MVKDIVLLQWVMLFFAGLLFLGPGFALLSFTQFNNRLNKSDKVIVSFAFSIAFWSLLFAWLQNTGITLNPWLTLGIFIAGWTIALIKFSPWKSLGFNRKDILGDPNQVALWLVLCISLVLGLWGIRHLVVGLGSDSYHHTLITQMIVDQGKIPENYLPYAPIITFSYHFGFHVLAAAMTWLTNIPTRLVVPIIGFILVPVSALSVEFFTYQLTKSKLAGAIAAAITGLICVFPSYMLNWGRVTQILGLALLTVFLGLFILWRESDYRRIDMVWIALAATGIVLSHYRVTLMAIIAVVILILLDAIYNGIDITKWRNRFVNWIMVAGIVLVLVSPWVWHVFVSLQKGIAVSLGNSDPSFYSLSRMGTPVTGYPTNLVLIVLALCALGLGWFKRNQYILWLSLWSGAMLFLSRPPFAGQFMDTISVTISLYIPLATAIGWLFVEIYQHLTPNRRWLQVSAIGLAMILGAWGAELIPRQINPSAAYVTLDDLQAAKWIQENTPQAAYFMDNTYNFPFSSKFIIGSDAGYWLPILTGRNTVTIPMSFTIERFSSTSRIDQLVNLHELNGHLTSSSAMSLLSESGVSYVYIGQNGGPIDVDELKVSPRFQLEYHQGNIYIFKFLTPDNR